MEEELALMTKYNVWDVLDERDDAKHQQNRNHFFDLERS